MTTHLPHTSHPTPFLSEDQIAGNAGNSSDLQRAEQALRQSEERYHLATRAGRVGVWEWNIKTGEFYLDPNLKALLGGSSMEVVMIQSACSKSILSNIC